MQEVFKYNRHASLTLGLGFDCGGSVGLESDSLFVLLVPMDSSRDVLSVTIDLSRFDSTFDVPDADNSLLDLLQWIPLLFDSTKSFFCDGSS